MYAIYCKLRDEKKLKDAEVSRATGISKSTFSDWKHGKTNPKADKLKTLAEFFGVSVEYLMGNEPRPLTLAEAIYLNMVKDEKTLAEYSERDKLILQATELLQEYSEEDLLWVLQMLEKMSPNKK